MTTMPERVARRLPAAYVAVLAAIRRGDSDAAIADAVGVDPSAVPSLVRLAAVKLLELEAGEASACPGQ